MRTLNWVAQPVNCIKMRGRYLRVWIRVRVRVRVGVRVKLRVKFRVKFVFWLFSLFAMHFPGFLSAPVAQIVRGAAREQEPVVLFTRTALQNTRAIDMNLH